MDIAICRLWVAACLVAALALGSGPAQAGPEDLTCAACYLVDDSGRVLFDRRGDVALPNASTTKMTTALVALEHLSLSDRVTVSPAAAATGGGGLDLQPGSTYPVETLLHALLMTSSNDAAVALAEASSGSQEDFVADMERYVAELGADETSYVTAHGLDMPGHASSAADLAVIATELLDNPVLAAIVALPTASVPGPGGEILLENRNLLLESYRGATGVKTGFTADAGHVLVASAERRGRRLIAVVMDSVDATADAAALLDIGWERLGRTTLLPAGTTVGALVLDTGSTPVAAGGVVRGPHAPAEVISVFEPASVMSLPITPGEVVGTVAIFAGSKRVATVDAVATTSVNGSDSSSMGDAVASLIAALGPFVGVGR